MKQEVSLFDKKWELVKHFKYSDKRVGYNECTKYVLDKGATIERIDGNPYIMIDNEKYIALLYNKGGGLYKEMKGN